MERSAIDRQQKEAEQAVSIAPPGLEVDPWADELEVLRQIRDGVTAQTPSLAITDAAVAPVSHANFPIPGSSRVVVPRTAAGGRLAVPSLVKPSLVMAANANRLAGTITNMGQADCLLLLAPAEEAASPGISAIFLVAHGGSWDLRLGPPLWCGSISALAIKTGAVEVTELAVSEV